MITFVHKILRNTTFMFKKLTFVCALAAAFVLFTSAKPSPAAKFDKEVSAIVKDMNVVGLSTAVVSGNKIVFTKGYGVKNLETQEPMTTDAYFKIGYCGRVLVPIAIFQCYDSGLINLSDDVSKYLGFELRNPEYPDDKITISHLLKQTSSLMDAKEWKSLADLNGAKFDDLWNDAKPGAKYKKCNKGFVILAAIVEKVAGVSFEEYAKQYIFAPLQINASYTPSDYKDVRVASYSYKDGEYKRNKSIYKNPEKENYVLGESTQKLGATTNLTINTEDMAKIVLTLMNNGECPLTKVRLYSEATSEKFLKPNKAMTRCSGISISTKEVNGTNLYYSTADSNGTKAVFAFDPVTKVGFFAVSNGANDGDFNKEMRAAFAAAFL